MFIPILDIMRKKTSESEGRFLTIEGIFESDQYTSIRRLLDLNRVQSSLELVCEVRDPKSSTTTFRLEDEKTMIWLRKKVEVLVNQFATIPVLVDSIAYTESLPEECRKGKWNFSPVFHGFHVFFFTIKNLGLQETNIYWDFFFTLL